MSVNSPNGATYSTACNNCRQKKRKCSRTEPCDGCTATGALCVFEEAKRRGPKNGYIEELNNRMHKLESIVLGQSLLISRYLTNSSPTDNGSLGDSLEELKSQLISDGEAASNSHVKKRKLSTTSYAASYSGTAIIPGVDVLKTICTLYFEIVHPWIPLLHEPSFWQAMDSDQRPSTVILQAITAATVRFSKLEPDLKLFYYKRCRDSVLLTCIDRFSVETLQASVILAFDTLCSGQGPRSWSVIASATRIVEQLGLSVEEEDKATNKLLNRVGFLTSPVNWTESETRRRIFWSVFLMDRFCSAATGWNTSLTSSDVKRRLPIEGTVWRDEYDGTTPYFNISQNALNPVDDMNALGGYAYLIEATEFLDRVVNFLRRESVDFSSSDDGFTRWFNLFQELDSMLVRWKASLPEKWQVSRVHSNGWMDQNLTLAHITHNASVILLHQNIAYVTPDERIKILSSIASETCLTAASEISTIATKFLYYTKNILPPQFCLCVFIAARALLAHSEFFDVPLKGEFDSLITALKDGSKRWSTIDQSQDNLAKQFMDRLENARYSNTTINVRAAAFEDEANLSFSFPQFPDINGLLSLSNSLEPTQYLQELDRIVLWDDGVAEKE